MGRVSLLCKSRKGSWELCGWPQAPAPRRQQVGGGTAAAASPIPLPSLARCALAAGAERVRGLAVPPPPCSLTCLLRSGRPQTQASRSNTRGPPGAAACLPEPSAPGGNEGAVEGALLLGHYLEKRDRPALPPAHPLSRPGPRATPPEGKLGVFHPHRQLSLPPRLFFPSKFSQEWGEGWGGGRGSSQPPSLPSPCLTSPRLPSIPCAPRPLWSSAPN